MFEIDWAKFHPYSSFFVPCLDVLEAKRQVKKTCKRLGYKVTMQAVVEDGVRGVRVWRME